VSESQACGADSINGLLEVARHRDLEVRLLDLRTSGDTAGDSQRVVGYGSFAVYARD
jgi:AmmeMemoRadiSam system protein B